MSVLPTSSEEGARFEAPGSGTMSHGLLRVMMVEDHPDIRAVAHVSLTVVGGFTVELGPSGPEALTRAAAIGPQLILLDMMMPDMDGPTTLSRQRKRPSMETAPIVFMTAKARPEELRECLRLGAIWDRHHA